MTIAVLTDRTTQGEESVRLVNRWVGMSKRHRQDCFVVAPTTFDLPERPGLRHVAARAAEADELSALADVAGVSRNSMAAVGRFFYAPAQSQLCQRLGGVGSVGLGRGDYPHRRDRLAYQTQAYAKCQQAFGIERHFE